ncbi:MAG: DNA repair protein RecO [Halioglobus sp.]|nr:DNA repair protein RecO [Halioglobus sp.]
MRVNLQPSFVLHSRPYRDSSAIVEIFTAEHGRLSAVARGVRRQGKKGGRGGLLQPFVPLLVSLSGRTELKTLGAVESAGPPLALGGESVFSGMYLNELLVRLLHRHDPHPELFAAYSDALRALADDGAPDPVLRPFELFLLRELGYNLALDADGGTGAPIAPGERYRFHPEQGLVTVTGELPRGVGIYPGADLLLLANGEFDGPARSTAKRLLREVLRYHLGDAPLRSRELFQAGGRKGARA